MNTIVDAINNQTKQYKAFQCYLCKDVDGVWYEYLIKGNCKGDLKISDKQINMLDDTDFTFDLEDYKLDSQDKNVIELSGKPKNTKVTTHHYRITFTEPYDEFDLNAKTLTPKKMMNFLAKAQNKYKEFKLEISDIHDEEICTLKKISLEDLDVWGFSSLYGEETYTIDITTDLMDVSIVQGKQSGKEKWINKAYKNMAILANKENNLVYTFTFK